jgi:hypothetical protein
MTSISTHTKIEFAPSRINFCGKIMTLEVCEMEAGGYRAVYWEGADDRFNSYGDDPKQTALELWKAIKKVFEHDINPVPDVKMNGRIYTLKTIEDAKAFAALWNGTPLFTINSI